MADPKLLSLLEKINNPIQQLSITLQVEGLYGFPDDWKLCDETNPNLFCNIVQYKGNDTFGSIKPRELTQKEKYEEYQKIVKKNKKEQKTPEEEEEMKKLIQQEEVEEQLKQEEYANFTDENQKLFFISEDKLKTPFMLFENPLSFTIDNVREWEEELQNGRNRVTFMRQPGVSEEEIVKLRKGKTKNVNNAELTQIVFKGVLDFTNFLEPGQLECQNVRAFLIQEEQNEVPKFNCEKLYVKVRCILNEPLTPLITEISPVAVEPIVIQKVPSKQQCVQAFQYDITLAMQALSDEYGKLFQSDQQKGKTGFTTMTVQKIQELQKKKEQFLNDINTSGKYKILSDRLRTSIIRVCIDKFAHEGLYQGVNKDEQDRLYAELYVFMMEEMQKTLAVFIQNNKEEIHEDLVASYEQNLKERERVFQNLFKESPLVRAQRLAKEYETINQIDQALKYYTNMVLLDQKSSIIFARYLLKIQRFKEAEQLVEMGLTEPNKDYELLMASLYIRRERYKEALAILSSLLKQEPINTLYNLMVAFIYKLMGNENMSGKYQRCTQRIFMRNMGFLTKNPSRHIPNPHELPNFKQQMIEQQEKAKKAPVLSQEQLDQIQIELIEYFTRQYLFDLAEEALQPIKDKTTTKIQVIRAQIHIFNQNFPEALQLIQKILTHNPKNYEVYLIKGTLCYRTEQFYEAEETFLKALSIQSKRSFDILLRLGYLYLRRKSWQDAKTIFEKAIEIQSNSSLSWLGLGIANLRLEDPLAEECLCQANIYEPFNGEVWGYMALNCLLKRRGQQAKQCLKRMEQTEVNDLDLLQELGDEMFKCQDFESAKKLYLNIYNTQKIISTQGQLLVKLGRVHDELRRSNEAMIFYQESLRFLEGENEKAQVKELIKRL